MRVVHADFLLVVDSSVVASTAVGIQQTSHGDVGRSLSVHDRVSQTDVLNLLILQSSIVRSDGGVTLLTRTNNSLDSEYSY